MSRASEQALESLHSLTAETITEEIEKYRRGEVLDPKSGMPLPVPAALIAQAIKLLKDNGIDQPRKEGNPLDLLASKLPQLSAVDPRGLAN